MATAVETIKNFMGVLTNYSQEATARVGQIVLDNAVRQVSTFSSMNEAVEGLKSALKDTSTDSTTRLQNATGMVIGNIGDYTADTGAITGSNAGGSTVKNAQYIVPEDNVDLSTLSMPTPGSTTPITYTGADGNSFTFNVKWPNSFTTVVEGISSGIDEGLTRVKNSKYHVDLNTLDENGTYQISDDDSTETKTSPTFGQMKSAITTAIKGLYNYWLKEGAKLNYDSLGLALNGQTIEIAFVAGGKFDWASAITYDNRNDTLASNHIYLAIDLGNYGLLSPTDPNGNTNYNGGEEKLYLDRVVAHEMVHAVMFATGTLKNNMPQFFTEGIADLVQGDDDYNSEQRENMITLINDSDTLDNALTFLEGTGSQYAYPAGDMLMRFIAKQSLDVTSIVGDTSQAQVFGYSTDDVVITNYTEADTVSYQKYIGDAWTSQTLNDLIIKENTGNSNDNNLLILRDVRGKFITLNTPSGNVYAYMAKNSNEIDGRNFGGGSNFEILFGSNYENDIVRAGNAGSILWGGNQGNDELFGGLGQDSFNYWYEDGNDTVQNAESQDSIFLRNMPIERITYAQINDGGVNIGFTDGGTLTINGTPSSFVLEDTNENITTYLADYQNKSWTQA